MKSFLMILGTSLFFSTVGLSDSETNIVARCNYAWTMNQEAPSLPSNLVDSSNLISFEVSQLTGRMDLGPEGSKTNFLFISRGEEHTMGFLKLKPLVPNTYHYEAQTLFDEYSSNNYLGFRKGLVFHQVSCVAL